MPDFPIIASQYPTLINGEITDLKPVILMDWSQDIDPTQFSDEAKRASFFSLHNKSDMTTSIAVEFVAYDPILNRISLRPVNDLDRSATFVCIVNDKVIDTFGRKSMRRFRWEFKTSLAQIGPVELLTPNDSIVSNVFPNLQWLSIPITGTVNYQVQLDERFDLGSTVFDSVQTINQTGTGQVTIASTPTGSFDSDVTYWWRVRAYTASATGGWSTPRSFYFGEVRAAHPTSEQRWTSWVEFEVAAVGFEDGLSNQRSWPDISIAFTSTPASMPNFKIVVKNLLPRNDKPTSYDDTTLTGSWAVTNGVYTFTPDVEISENTRYELTIPATTVDVNGKVLGSVQSYFFTGPYTPYYVHSRTIRARFMSAEQQIPEDLINFKIFQTSLDAKARFYSYFFYNPPMVWGDMLKEEIVRDSADLNSYAALKWVEASTYYNILKSILAENLRNVGRSRKQGDYEESLDDSFITGLKEALKLAEDEIKQWEMYLIPAGDPVAVSKGMNWSDRGWDIQPAVWKVSRRDNYF